MYEKIERNKTLLDIEEKSLLSFWYYLSERQLFPTLDSPDSTFFGISELQDQVSVVATQFTHLLVPKKSEFRIDSTIEFVE